MAVGLSLWRRRIAVAAALLSTVAFVAAVSMYARYASGSDLYTQHVQERIGHAHILNIFWRLIFYGSPALFLLSLFGLGWARWLGAITSCCALGFALMTLGALCGPFMC